MTFSITQRRRIEVAMRMRTSGAIIFIFDIAVWHYRRRDWCERYVEMGSIIYMPLSSPHLNGLTLLMIRRGLLFIDYSRWRSFSRFWGSLSLIAAFRDWPAWHSQPHFIYAAVYATMFTFHYYFGAKFYAITPMLGLPIKGRKMCHASNGPPSKSQLRSKSENKN